MPRAAPIQTSFNAGEFSPEVSSRVDFGKYANGCTELKNLIPLVQGPCVRRTGSRHVAEVKNSALRTWLVRFEFSKLQAFMLEFGDGYIRFYASRGQVVVTGVAAWSNSTAYVVGDLVVQGGVNYYCIAAHTNQVPPNATYWYPLTGAIYEIPSPYSAASLVNDEGTFALRFVQTGDVVYLVGGGVAPYKLSRFGATRWTMQRVAFTGGPFLDLNDNAAITVYASAATGGVTLTSAGGGASFFGGQLVDSLFMLEQKAIDDVNRWEPGKAVLVADKARSEGKTYVCTVAGTTGTVRPTHTEGEVRDGNPGARWQYNDDGVGIVKITSSTPGATTTGDVQKRIPDDAVGAGNPTTRWAFGAWSAAQGYPEHVALFRERLAFAKGNRLWLSVVGDFENFADRDAGITTADRAISLAINSDDNNDLTWLAAMEDLLVGTGGGEFRVTEINPNDALAPGNTRAPRQHKYGGAKVAPVLIGESVLFVQKSGRRLREMRFDFNFNKYAATDASVLATHLTDRGIAQMAYAAEPYSVNWIAMTDGTLVAYTYNREESVSAFSDMPLDGAVESVAEIPAPSGTKSDLWFIVRRTINGVTRRYVEFLSDSDYLDSSLTYAGAPTTTLSGLGHLEGKTVGVMVNGAVHPDRAVSGGQITLQRAATSAVVGLRCPWRLKTLRIEAGAGDGTSQGKTKRIRKVGMRFKNTLGVRVGSTDANLVEVPFRKPSDPMDQAPPLFSGDKIVDFPGGHDTDGYVLLVGDQPYPAELLAIMPQVATEDG